VTGVVEGDGAGPRPWKLPSPRQVLLVLGVFTLLSLIGGGVYAYLHRHDTICRDGRPPAEQLDLGLGQIEYKCHDGQIVTK
jgi:hypothetical protein